MSTITESTAEGSEDDALEAAFEKSEQRIWNNATRQGLHAVTVAANIPSKVTSGSGLGRVRKIARAPKNQSKPAQYIPADSIHSIYVADQVRHLRQPSISFQVAAMALRPKPSAPLHQPIRVPPSADRALCLPPIPELLPDVPEDITREVRRRLDSMYPTVEPEPRALILDVRMQTPRSTVYLVVPFWDSKRRRTCLEF